MSLLDWLLGRDPLPPTPPAQCPSCGAALVPFWAEDDAVTVTTIGGDRAMPPGDHLVLRVQCDCGFSGRANTTRILNPQLLARG